MTGAQERLIIDGLVVSRWDRNLFADMQTGGLSAANCTCCIWEGFEATMKNVADLRRLIEENADIVTQVFTAADIDRARAEKKVGIILGWQNSTGFGDYLPFVATFAELGLRIVQLTYNTANMAGCGCYESVDRGLTDFGRDLVSELHKRRILIDLSHVGSKTARDVIDFSSKPVAYSHCCPSALKDHPRNKSDEEIRYIVDRGGFVGVAGVPHFLARGVQSDVDDMANAVAHVINAAGEDMVGIGTDVTQGQGPDFFESISLDKGYGRRLTSFADLPILRGFERLNNYGNIVAALERKGLSERVIDKVIGRNWYRFLNEVWGA
jgi:membrane dipeptidase